MRAPFRRSAALCIALLLAGCGDEDGFSPTVETVSGSYSASSFWTLEGSTVTFNQTADTFIRDAQFTASRDRLTGEGTFDGQTVRLVLTKVVPE